MIKILKKNLKKIISNMPLEYFQRASAVQIINNKFIDIYSIKTLETREELWNFAIHNYWTINKPVTYVEFGVWEGQSIKYFSENNNNDKSLFIGLDSFEGLPEDWGSMKKGSFSKEGKSPTHIRDERVRFIKGLFQLSWDEADSAILNQSDDFLFVHYDADLYSSTLFALTKMDSYHKEYFAIFDEFFNEECLALYAYLKSYNSSVEFLAKTDRYGYPNQVLCRICPAMSKKELNFSKK